MGLRRQPFDGNDIQLAKAVLGEYFGKRVGFLVGTSDFGWRLEFTVVLDFDLGGGKVEQGRTGFYFDINRDAEQAWFAQFEDRSEAVRALAAAAALRLMESLARFVRGYQSVHGEAYISGVGPGLLPMQRGIPGG